MNQSLKAVPANTTYVADTTTLNGQPVRQPDGGVSPLVAGIDLSSTDLTPPLPGSGEGVLSPGGSAVMEFHLRVNDGVPAGTLIVNQAVVASEERPDLLTDGDGNPATGPEPTVVVVGDAQRLEITKEVAVVGGGPALAGATLEYVVRVQNVGTVRAQYVVISDDIAMDSPGYLAYVAGSATLDASAAGVRIRARYSITKQLVGVIPSSLQISSVSCSSHSRIMKIRPRLAGSLSTQACRICRNWVSPSADSGLPQAGTGFAKCPLAWNSSS